MVDENDDTVQQPPTVRGVGEADSFSDTAVAPPGSTGPAAGSVTRQIRKVPFAELVATTPFAPVGGDAEARYKMGARIGQGGMGEVLLAYDEHIGREVAVKRMRAAAPSPEELARFVREARVQGKLQHPTIVPVHDIAVDRDGRPFFVMKRLTGTEMNDLLKQLRSGDDPDVAGTRKRLMRAFVDVCLAVEFAHSQGIIHRDLKPANIMLGDFGEVYVLDWGVARAVTDGDEPGITPSVELDLKLDTGETREGTVLGTPAYMAPEQLVGERAGPAADIYALGCILFEIVSGDPLHKRSRSLGQAFEVVDPRPSARRPDSPPELDVICERAIKIDPGSRFPSARALGDAVQAFLDGDRDVAMRRTLARQHITEAREALALGEAEEHRRAAMRAAGRALALDPTATEAADLVAQIMLLPPREVPVEVERGLAAIDLDTGRSQGRLAAIAVLGYLAFVPLLIWTGVRDPRVVIVFAVLAIASSIQVFWLTRKEHIPAVGIYMNACINAVLIGLVARIVGPFIIAPSLVITTLMAYSSHPQFGRIRVLAMILGCAVAVPWALELAGVLSPTYYFRDGEIVLTSPIIQFTPEPTQLAFALLLVATITIVALMSRSIALRQRDATRKLELQAWHLRQIVPTSVR
ncbi:MAG TPA: serine/threonine-protein kinase [Kofleriaceae bacterium]